MTSIASSKKPQKATVKRKTARLEVITCQCGTQIMVVPDVKAMSKAIEAHINSHKTKDKSLSNQDLDRLRDRLIAEIFHKIPR